MRILFVHPSFFLKESGVSSIVTEMVNGLSKKGLSVDVLTTDAFDSFNSSNTTYLKANAYHLYKFKVIKQLAKRKIYFPIDSFPLVARAFVKQYDVVHLNEYRSFQNVIIANQCQKLGVPYFLQPHGTLTGLSNNSFEAGLKLIFDETFGYKTLRNASKLIALTEAEAAQCEKFVGGDKISILPNAVNLNQYEKLPTKGMFRRKYGIDDKDITLLFLGRIYWVKGVDVLIKAFDLLLRESGINNVRLVIAGPDDGALAEVRSLVNSLKLSTKVLFTGPLYGAEKLSAFADSDLFIMPSRSEAFPMTILEAYACGKPIIASDVGGLRSIVLNQQTGLLVPPDEPRQLSLAIQYLLENPKIALEMGLAGKRRVGEKFSIDSLITQLASFYMADFN
jgi:glycosyltransferase involved in cell wall biosynthesis